MPLIEVWIESHRPDVLCLQETKVADRSFPAAPFRALGYEVVTVGEGGRGGVAMLARSEMIDVVLGIPGAKAPLAEQRTISATVAGLRIHTAYAPNGRKAGTMHHEIKLAWFELFRAWVEMDGLEAGSPTLVIGDLNIAPTDLDVWEPTRYRSRNLTSPPERAAFDRLLEAGLVDVVRQQHPEVRLFTWWNRRGDFYESDRGWRLDHALADPATARRTSAVWIDRVERGRPGSSDHAPLVVDLDL